MVVGTLEEVIDDRHAIVSSSENLEYFVSIMSFVDKDKLETGCTVLLHHKVNLIKLFIFSTVFDICIFVVVPCSGWCNI